MSERPSGDLPGLLEWGEELREATALQERRRPWRRLPLRRLGIAVAALLLIVPGAVATRGIWGHPVADVGPGTPAASTPAVRLAEGHAGDVRWRLGGHEVAPGRICTRLDAFRGARRIAGGTACATPRTRGALSVMVVPADGAAFVLGTADAAVRSVAVTASSGDRVRVGTVALSAETLRRSGLGDAARVYVAVFPRGVRGRASAPRVAGYGADGRLVAGTDPAGRR